jgi:hypothetical protein
MANLTRALFLSMTLNWSPTVMQRLDSRYLTVHADTTTRLTNRRNARANISRVPVIPPRKLPPWLSSGSFRSFSPPRAGRSKHTRPDRARFERVPASDCRWHRSLGVSVSRRGRGEGRGGGRRRARWIVTGDLPLPYSVRTFPQHPWRLLVVPLAAAPIPGQ